MSLDLGELAQDFVSCVARIADAAERIADAAEREANADVEATAQVLQQALEELPPK